MANTLDLAFIAEGFDIPLSILVGIFSNYQQLSAVNETLFPVSMPYFLLLAPACLNASLDSCSATSPFNCRQSRMGKSRMGGYPAVSVAKILCNP